MVVTNMKLKIKLATKKPGSVPCESLKQVEAAGSHNGCMSGNGNSKAQCTIKKNCSAYLSDGIIASGIVSGKPESSLLGMKRRLEGLVEIPNGKRPNLNGKRLKMDRSMTLKCCIILKKLMKHPAGWIFNKPVDPVTLKIPDYFSVISKPMDLGTIKSKLDKSVYSFAEEFESDVRLTFSNAMLYNPPTNQVHLMAKELDAFFDTQWKPVGVNMNRQSINVSHGIEMTGSKKERQDISKSCLKTPSVDVDTLPKRSTLVTEKMKPKAPMEASIRVPLCDMKPADDGKVKNIRPSKTRAVHIMDFDGAEKGCPEEESSFSSPARVDLLPKGPVQLKEKMTPDDLKGALIRKKVPCSNPRAKGALIRKKVPCSNPHAKGALIRKKATCSNPIAALHGDSKAAVVGPFSVGKDTNISPSKNIFIHDMHSDGATSYLEEESSFPSPSHVDLFPKGPAKSKEAMKPENPKGASVRKNVPFSNPEAAPHSDSKFSVNSLEGQDRNTSKSWMNRCDPVSNGAVSNLDECAYSGTNITSTSAVTGSEGWDISAFEINLIPNKALRAAMLKRRFADTILKAQQKTLLDPGDKVATVKKQQEKESLERKQREEKARIEAQIKASRMQRQREREAARIALEKMEKSVDIDDNFYMLREIQILIGDCIQTCFSHGYRQSNVACNQFKNGKVRSPLEQLGLFIKEEYMEDDNEEALSEADLEDGELLF
ncbi:hypothetical protein Ancab_033992 [Ancistrocladus abbreviatus]